MIKKIICIVVFGISILYGSAFAMIPLVPVCGDHKFQTDIDCPSGCIWDCGNQKCRYPKCADYTNNLTCPAECYWNCSQKECVPGNPKD